MKRNAVQPAVACVKRDVLVTHHAPRNTHHVLRFTFYVLRGIIAFVRRGARVAEWGGLENRCSLRATVGSNPTLSAKSIPTVHKLTTFARISKPLRNVFPRRFLLCRNVRRE